jgi:hypothetical protein
MLFFAWGLPHLGPVLHFEPVEGNVRAPDLQDQNARVEQLAEKVEALRRFL